MNAYYEKNKSAKKLNSFNSLVENFWNNKKIIKKSKSFLKNKSLYLWENNPENNIKLNDKLNFQKLNEIKIKNKKFISNYKKNNILKSRYDYYKKLLINNTNNLEHKRFTFKNFIIKKQEQNFLDIHKYLNEIKKLKPIKNRTTYNLILNSKLPKIKINNNWIKNNNDLWMFQNLKKKKINITNK